LESLNELIFCDLTNLESLDLNGNLLTVLPAKLFHGNLKLATLNLSDNQLVYFDWNLFSALMVLTRIDIRRNNCADVVVEVNPGDLRIIYENVIKCLSAFFMKFHGRTSGTKATTQSTPSSTQYTTMSMETTLDIDSNTSTTTTTDQPNQDTFESMEKFTAEIQLISVFATIFIIVFLLISILCLCCCFRKIGRRNQEEKYAI
jgi:hypothetical protein